MEEEIKILENLESDILKACECSLTSSSYKKRWKKEAETIRILINKYKVLEANIKEQEKIIELAIDELYLFNAYDCDYSDLKEHTCIKNDDDTVEIQKAKCKKCIREIIEKKAKGE